MPRKLLLCLLYLLFLSDCFCQKLNFGCAIRSLTVNEGLPSNCVYDVLKDKEGYLWFSTNNGVARFDGFHFDIYNISNGLQDNDVFFCRQDKKGRIWMFCSNSKISIFHNGKIHSNYTYQFLSKINSSSWITSFIEDNEGNIWLSSHSDIIFRIDKFDTVTQFKVSSDEAFISDLFIYIFS
jgi:ligand-binding sensor domain-containing protein